MILANSQRAWPLFAAILRDWSDSIGIAPVGMARILWAEGAARATIAVLVAVAAMALWSVTRPVARGRVVRLAAGGAGAILIAGPLWATAQDYLFVFSILPGLSTWLGTAMAVAGLALIVFAIGRGRAR